jgi:ribosomal protein S18 acetylase RimI-like enzyme
MQEVPVPILIRNLTAADLDHIDWSGGRSHIRSVGVQLERVTAGLADYLVACPPSGLPIGTAGIDYVAAADAGMIHQVAVHPALQSCGIGTLLMRAAEERILSRGRQQAELWVEHSNPRARALYERLGYAGGRDEPAEWDDDGPDGAVTRYRTVCTVMRKQLG